MGGVLSLKQIQSCLVQASCTKVKFGLSLQAGGQGEELVDRS